MSKCLACKEELVGTPLMVLDNMPTSAQDIPDAEHVKNDRGIRLHLYQCSHCALVQFDCEPVTYYRDVIRSGGYSTTMHDLRYSQYKHLIETYHLENKKFIEVGCGQGEFLSVLKEFPVEGFGIEHKEDLVKLARTKGLNVEQGFVEDGKTKIVGAPFDVFLSFNFFEHQPNPNEMLQGIYNNLTDDGMGLITVPSLEYILEHDGYYELIRDHLAYYTFDTLRFILEKNGFEVLEQEMVNRDTLAMIVRKRKKVDISNLIDSYSYIRKEIIAYIDSEIAIGHKVSIWGASHQGFTLAATADLGDKVTYIIDSAPFKQGRYAPTSHIPIISPDKAVENPVDTVIIVAPGYTDEIADIIRNRFPQKTTIMVLKSNHLEQY